MRAALFCSVLSVLLPSDLAAQGHAALADSKSLAAAPGRFLVTFRDRSFDLEPLRGATLGRADRATLNGLLARLGAQMLTDQAAFVEFVEKELGGHVRAQWWIINGCAVEIGPDRLEQLRGHPRVLRIDVDAVCSPAGPISASTNGSNHATDGVQAMGIVGHRSAVAIVDSGQDSNMAGVGRPHSVYYPNGNPNQQTGLGLGGSRLVNNVQFGVMPADDVDGHGTAVASVAAGSRWNTGFSADNGHAPGADIIGYSIADFPTGESYHSTMIAAWQSVAAGRGVERTLSANLSYGGEPDPTHPLEQAADSVALNADVLVTVAAGNSAGNTTGSQGLTNGLAVGSIAAYWHNVSSFSARGPLNGDPQRNFPDLVAIGDYMVMAARDLESGNTGWSGTSFAAPHVAGAAILYRTMANTTALEAKAAILATTQDISAQNPGLGINDFGQGMLRVDRLVEVARGASFRGQVGLSPAAPNSTLEFWVESGQTYDAAIAWHRYNLAANSASNVDIEIEQGGNVIASSYTPRNTYERVRFVAPQTGTARLRILGAALEIGNVTVAYVVAGAKPVATPVWRQVRTLARPSVHADHSMVFDAARGVTVLFGGDDLTSARNETWGYDGTQWTQRFPSVSPTPRIAFAMGYDPVRQRVVVFGGLTYHGGSFLGDTWEYDGQTWIQMGVAVAPTARAASELAFDYTRNELLMFGGENAPNDTWIWNGQRWLQLSPATAPSPRMHYAMASDPHNRQVMLFGGRSISGGFNAETWLWTGSQWLQLAATASPPPASDMAFAFDSDRGRLILAGGFHASLNPLGGTWEWDGAGWQQRIDPAPYASGSDPVASWHGAWDSARRRFVVFGGRNSSSPEVPRFGSAHDETWEYQVPFAALATVSGLGCPSAGGANNLEVLRRPWLGSTYEDRGSGMPNMALVCSVFGFSPLGVPLSQVFPQGQPGCVLRVSPDFVDVLVAVGGAATWQVALPPVPSLLGGAAFHQMVPLQFDLSMNLTAVTATNALRLTFASP